jgi:DNA ligase-1
MRLPKLFKKTQTGALQEWTISVDGCIITTIFGQVGGRLQTTEDIIKEGKNLGKANATTPQQQAEAEANAKWQKQLKKGYSPSMEKAENGETEAVIEGGILPMLSINKSYPKDPILDKYLKYPCLIERKLDGVCCIAIIENGKATLWSRTRKNIKSVPHIVEELQARFPNPGYLVLHGELYNHDYSDRFEDLISIIKSSEPDAEGLYKVIQFHVYDLPEHAGYTNNKTPYKDRYDRYCKLIAGTNPPNAGVIAVPAYYCNNLKELLKYYEQFLEEGYEGGMAKNLEAPYEGGKRSHNILKMKEFADAEFIIIDIEDGKGKDADVASKFVCKMPDSDKTFKARMKCPHAKKKEYWLNKDKYLGKFITVTYKRLTKDGIPYIPVGRTIRDYE